MNTPSPEAKQAAELFAEYLPTQGHREAFWNGWEKGYDAATAKLREELEQANKTLAFWRGLREGDELAHQQPSAPTPEIPMENNTIQFELDNPLPATAPDVEKIAREARIEIYKVENEDNRAEEKIERIICNALAQVRAPLVEPIGACAKLKECSYAYLHNRVLELEDARAPLIAALLQAATRMGEIISKGELGCPKYWGYISDIRKAALTGTGEQISSGEPVTKKERKGKMNKVIMLIAAIGTMAVSSVQAGDFAGAADAGAVTNGICALVAFLLLVVGTIVFLWKQTKLPAIIFMVLMATVMPLRAGDFAGAADAGYYIPTGWFVNFWSMWWGNTTAPFGKFTPVPKKGGGGGGQMSQIYQ